MFNDSYRALKQMFENDRKGTLSGHATRFASQLTIESLEPRAMLTVLLNEIEANPPGGDDNRYEYVELRGTPGASLNNVYFVVFDGISSNNPGNADLVVNLSSSSLGSNGLLVIKSASGTGHSLAPGTTLVENSFFTKSGGFENGTLSFYLFSSTNAFTTGTDYDTNDDGTLDHLPLGAAILDHIALVDTDSSASGDKAYGRANLTEFNSTGTPDAATRFNNDDSVSSAAWYGGELFDVGNIASQLSYDSTRRSANEPANAVMTPGAVNFPNQPPLVTPTGTDLTYTQGDAATPVDSGITVSDADILHS